MNAPGMVIVGAGECGVRAALTLREAGYGGAVTLIGEESHPPYERPPLSKTVGALKPIAGSAGLGNAVDFRHGAQAVAIDRTARDVVLADGERIPFVRLLLATGARARNLPGTGVTLRTHDAAVRIGAALRPGTRLVLIGGGFIGLELAALARAGGVEVTVIEAADRLLTRGAPAEIASVLLERHRAEGVAFRFGASVTEIGEDHVTLVGGDHIEADLVVIGVGAIPETALAEAAGLTVENGVAVDATLATSDPQIFAAGDCASLPHPLYDGRRVRFESWRVAQEHGAMAACNMLGAGETLATSPWFWSDQYDLTLQIAGLADGAAQVVRRDLDGGAFVLFHLAEDGRLLAASGIGSGNSVAKTIRLAEMMINKRARPDPVALADNSVNLKKLLAA